MSAHSVEERLHRAARLAGVISALALAEDVDLNDHTGAFDDLATLIAEDASAIFAAVAHPHANNVLFLDAPSVPRASDQQGA